MRIGVLGSGGMADALGGRWVGAGHEVVIGGRSPERSRELAARIGAAPATPADAVAFGDAVLLAVPAAVAAEVLGHAPGRVVVDCTNSVVPGRFVLDEPRAAVRLAESSAAHVVKAFNLCHVDVWRQPSPAFEGKPLGVPLCGDSPDALGVVRELVRSTGCVPVDGGPLERAELLEAMTAFAIGLWVGGADVRAMFPTIP
ncbi:NAD(P)-binding domain-containing protein [Saccharothrix sp. 6-C]|uniref:NADPH-dependent F420 reductase n=1 Tax=Saccharothrix sp. 6-C TaxID=2781735 RepID=UPI001917A32F|nr:NAD(P)-binding domain-containing protein [Saccharothrix sp. 6-C]QQQ73527.1 NAD(P)-binding domain-containing protein [Saccharothrix sp. 6-C]